MKIKQFTVRNVQEAIDKFIPPAYRREGNTDALEFLDILKTTTPGERENVVIETLDPE